MNVRHTQCVLHSFSIKNIFYDEMDFRAFYFDVAKYVIMARFQPVSVNSDGHSINSSKE